MGYCTHRESVPAAPFVAWVNRQLHQPYFGPRNEPESPNQRLARRAETTTRAVYRWKNSLKGAKRNGKSYETHTDRYERTMVENALDRAEGPHLMRELYPDLYEDTEIRDRFCRHCDDEVTTGPDNICPFCESNTREKAKPVRGGWSRPDRRGSKYTETQLRALHVAHLRGRSINALARQTYEQVGYATHGTAANAISRQWKHLGLAARDRIEQAVLSSTKHGRKRRNQTNVEQNAYRRWHAKQMGWNALQGPGRPRCAGVRTQHPDKGGPCERAAMEGSEYCLQHDPARRAEVVSHLEAVRANIPPKRMVPMGPFTQWLMGIHAELGSWREVGAAVGLSISAVHCYGRGLSPTDKQPKHEVGAEVIARCEANYEASLALEVAA